jgi:hypothetical protein
VAYPIDALKTFAKVEPAKTSTIGVKVALLGRTELEINESAKK